MSQPPQVPPSQTRTGQPRATGDLGAPQAVFDTVGGPNLRLRDNLIQLAAVIVGAGIGAVVAMMVEVTLVSIVIGGLIGFVIGGFISGAVLGIYRTVTGVKRMAKK